MGNIKRGILTFAKAQCSASVATAADFALTIVLAKLCRVWYADATLIGAIFGGMVNCSINYRWVFHAIGMKKKYVALRYIIVWTGSIVLNTLGTYKLTEATGIDFVISKAVVAVAVAVLWNYQMQRVFVFHANKAARAQDIAVGGGGRTDAASGVSAHGITEKDTLAQEVSKQEQ